MNLIIERLDGTRYSFEDYGKVLDFYPDSPYSSTEVVTIEGRAGALDLGTTHGYRTLRGSFYIRSYDALDFPRLRNELFRVFNSQEEFFLIDSREPQKRWKVKCDGSFTIDQLVFNKGKFDADFISYYPYAESVGTSLYPDYRDGVPQARTDQPISYVHSDQQFSIWNDGDIAIDPRENELKIIFTGASENLTIRNLTTGDEWVYNGISTADDIIELYNIRSLKNGSSIFGQTNHQLLTLAPGMNEFQVTGVSDPFEISFDLRFYYI
jgi:hypothetical protein